MLWKSHPCSLTLLHCTLASNSDIKARRVLLVLPKEEGSDMQPSPQVVDTWTALQTAQLRKLDLVCGESYLQLWKSVCASSKFSNLRSIMACTHTKL
jgi:hypothetical protein